jgi:biopolymer transport protein ExbD
MKLRRNPSEGAEVASESLNDIMFFLLLFFLLISTMSTPQVIKADLPEATAAKQVNKQPVALSVTKDDTGTIHYFLGPEETPIDQLEGKLQSMLKKMESATAKLQSENTGEAVAPTVVLRMDKGLKVANLVDVLKIGEKIKCKLVLATSPVKG